MESTTLDQLTRTVHALADEVSTLGECECDESFGPCERHSEVLAQFSGSSSRSADQLVSVVLDELVSLLAHTMIGPATVDTDIAQCAQMVLDSEDFALWQSFGAALSALDPFTSWIDDRELADAARELCDEMESDLPEGYLSQWDDGWTLWKLTGGPLVNDQEPYELVSEWVEGSLEVYGTARVTPGELSVQTVTIVVGIGGPHVEVTFDLCSTYCRATAGGWWGSDHVERTVTASGPLASWVEEYAATIEESAR